MSSSDFIDFYDSIKNDYIEFSNFALRPITIDGVTWPTSEHYYHGQKIQDSTFSEEYKNLIRIANTPNKSKMLGNQKITGRFGNNTVLDPKVDNRLLSDIIKEYKEKGIKMKDNWEEIKENVMYKAIKEKFTQHKDLLDKLLKTGEKTIREASPTDSYWGIGKDEKGQNRLGVLLMKLRDEFSNQNQNQNPTSFKFENSLFINEQGDVRPYDNKTKNVKSVKFWISVYGRFTCKATFSFPVTEKYAIEFVEKYLSEPLTPEYFYRIRADLLCKEDEEYEHIKNDLKTRGDCVGTFLEESSVDENGELLLLAAS